MENLNTKQRESIFNIIKNEIRKKGYCRVGWAVREVAGENYEKSIHNLEGIANTIIQTGEYIKEYSLQVPGDINIRKNPDYNEEFSIINITNETFLNRIKGQQFYEGEKYVVIGKVLIDQSNLDWEFRKLKGITFQDEIIFEKVDLLFGMWFTDCEFQKGIILNNVATTQFDVRKYNTKNHNILFINCTIESIKIENDCNFYRGVLFENCKQIKKLLIDKSTLSNEGLYIRNSNILSTFQVRETNCDIIIINSVFNFKFRLIKVKGRISVSKSKFIDEVDFWNTDYNYKFEIYKSVFEDKVKIESCRITNLELKENEFKSSLNLKIINKKGNVKGSLKELNVYENKFIDGFILDGSFQNIQNLNLHLTPNIIGLIKIQNCTLIESKILGINQNAKILFHNVIFQHLNFVDLTNFNDISFTKCIGNNDSSFIAFNTDFGITKFNDFSFKSFKKISMENVILINIFASNVDWFEDNVLNYNPELTEFNLKHFRAKREVNRQIKQALKSNGNIIESLEFQSRELKTFKKEIELNDRKNSDRVILWLSQSNNFGISWWKPTWILFFVTLGYYLLLIPIFSVNISYTISFSFHDLNYTLSEIWNNKAKFFQLLDPLRNFSSVYGTSVNDFVYFIDFLHRVFLGVFFFQIIRAFRKFVN